MASTPKDQTVSGIFQSSRDTIPDNSTGAVAISSKRAQVVTIETFAGDSAMDEVNDAIRVNTVAGGAAGGTSMVDDSAFTPGGTSFTPAGGTFRSVRDLVDDNDGGAFAMTQRRGILSTLEGSGGTEVGQGGGTEAAALRVTIANDSTGLVSVDDNAGSLTVDAPVGTPVAVRTSDGAAFIDPRDINNTTKTLKTEDINHAGAGDNTIIASVASKRLKVYSIVLNAVGTVSAKWKDGAAIDLTGAMDFQAREGYTVAVTPPGWVLATTAGNALILNLSGAIGVRGWVSYWDDDAT